MTSTSRTRKASKADVDESPNAARRPRGTRSPPVTGHAVQDRAGHAPEPAREPVTDTSPARTTKLSRLIALLAGEEGTTIGMLCEATGWQAHSVRGAIAGTLKRKGIVVISDRSGTGPRRYRIGSTS